MTLSVGHASYVGVGEESAWATPVARAYFSGFIEDTLKGIQQRVQTATFRGRHQFERIQGKLGAEGGVGVEYNFADRLHALLVKHGLGSVSTQADTPVVGAHRHTFTMADAPPTGGLSVEMGRNAASAFLYSGFRVDELTFALEPDGYLKMTAKGAAKDETLVSASSPSYATSRFAHHQQAAVTWGGSSKTVKSFEFTIKQGLDLDRRVLGSSYIIDPQPGGKSEVTGKFDMFFESLSEYSDFMAATERALVLTLTSASFITGTTPFKLTFTFAGAELEGETPVVDSPGHLSIPLMFRAYETAGAKPVAIVLDSSLTAI